MNMIMIFPNLTDHFLFQNRYMSLLDMQVTSRFHRTSSDLINEDICFIISVFFWSKSFSW